MLKKYVSRKKSVVIFFCQNKNKNSKIQRGFDSGAISNRSSVRVPPGRTLERNAKRSDHKFSKSYPSSATCLRTNSTMATDYNPTSSAMFKTDSMEAIDHDHLCKSMLSIKFSFNNQIRRTKTVENLLTYDFLVCAAKKLFQVLHQTAAVEFLWSDDEGDMIHMSSDEELVEAIRIMNTEHRSSCRFEVRTGFLTPPSTFLSANVDAVIPIHTKAVRVVHHGVKCFECDRKGKGVSPIIGVRYKCLVRHLDLCEDCEMMESQPFPMIKHYIPEKVAAATTLLERRRRMGRGSLKGPHYRVHSRGLSLSRLEQPHPKSLTWLSYLRSLSGGPTSSTPTPYNQSESENPLKISRLPFCLKLQPMETAIAPFNTIPVATANTESIGGFEVVEKADQTTQQKMCNLPCIRGSAMPSSKPVVRLVRDHELPNCEVALSGSIFLKTWRIRNDGAHRWPPNVTLLCTGGDPLALAEGELALAVTCLAPGQGTEACISHIIFW